MTRAKKEKEKQPEPVRLIYNGWVIEGRREGTRTFWRTMVIYEPRPYAHANSLEEAIQWIDSEQGQEYRTNMVLNFDAYEELRQRQEEMRRDREEEAKEEQSKKEGK